VLQDPRVYLDRGLRLDLVHSPLSIQYPPRPLLHMASLRALNLVRTNARGGLLTPGKVVLLNALPKPQRRHASFYNADIAGLTEEEAEVSISSCVVFQGFVNESLVSDCGNRIC